MHLDGNDFTLSEGAHSLRLDFPADTIEIDRIILASDPAFAPSGLGSASFAVEAESTAPQPPFELDGSGTEVLVRESSLRNAKKPFDGYARLATRDLPDGVYYLWARAPLSLAAPSSVCTAWHRGARCPALLR